jgi:hypothetical protein
MKYEQASRLLFPNGMPARWAKTWRGVESLFAEAVQRVFVDGEDPKEFCREKGLPVIP